LRCDSTGGITRNIEIVMAFFLPQNPAKAKPQKRIGKMCLKQTLEFFAVFLFQKHLQRAHSRLKNFNSACYAIACFSQQVPSFRTRVCFRLS
jgi:hypothetical protein